MRTVRKYIYIVFLFLVSPAHAQEAHRVAIEETLREYLLEIRANSLDTSRTGQELLWGANISLMAYLKNICQRFPGMMTEEFASVGDIDGRMYGMNIITSEDKNMRIYCWDTWTSREQHRFNSLLQYKIGNEITTTAWADVAESRGRIGKALNCFSEINVIYDKEEKPIYLVMSYRMNDGHEGGHELNAYRLDSILVPAPVFNFYGQMKSSLSVYNDRTTKGKTSEDDTNIKIGADGRSVYVTVIHRSKTNPATKGDEKNYHVYQFNGSEFVYKENLNN